LIDLLAAILVPDAQKIAMGNPEGSRWRRRAPSGGGH
jgi:hypothetical protein